jgi:sugar phosphate isomerase/epimerase
MKLGVMGALFTGMKLDESLDYCQRLGLSAIELPAGAYPGDPWGMVGIHKNKKALAELKAKIADRGLEVHGIAVHGNCVHPDK